LSGSDRCAYVTLVSNADYIPGALALARSLAAVAAQAPLVVLARPAAGDLSTLEQAGCSIERVEQLPLSADFRKHHQREALHRRSPFSKGEKPAFHDPLDNFCKLQLWRLEQFEKVVFLDADTLVVKNIDRLFEYPEFSAAPNLYETLADMHRLNSGVFVARPSQETLERMLQVLDQPGAYWRRTDQTFLEHFFPDWHGLPYTYNVLQYVYFNLPQLWHWPGIRVVHYQYEKPWQDNHPKAAQLQPLIELWHRVAAGEGIPEQLPAAASDS